MHPKESGRKHRRARIAAATLGAATIGAAIAASGMTFIPQASAKTATASGGSSNPIVSSSLTQDGQRFVWHAQLAKPFSAPALVAGHRSLCLAIDRRGTAESRICVTAGRTGRAQLTEQGATTAKAGSASRIPATIIRSSSREIEASFPVSRIDPGYKPVRWQALSGEAQTAYGHASSIGSGTSMSFPAAPKPLAVHEPQLVGCVPSGPSEVSSGPTNQKEIALSFDDGPSPDPTAMTFVNLLAREHVPATFFEIGEQIPEYDSNGAAERAMLADGDMIGDHTWSHPDMTTLSPAVQRSQLQMTIDAIKQRTGFTPCMWRPPYGSVNSQLVSLARSMGLITVLWNDDPQDWSTPGTPVIYQRVVSQPAMVRS